MHNLSFKRHRFPPDIIRQAIWLYARFTLSYRDVEDLLAERGLDKRWSRFLRQGFKVDLTMRRTIHHEDAQTVHG